DWTLASITEGTPGSAFLFECPDFFELPVDGDASRRKWVLAAANSEYAVGTFDGTRFAAEQRQLPGHRGRGFYAAQTFSDIPAADGRRIQIGWFQTETKGMPFNQSMTIPLELRLVSTPEGARMTFTPVRELEALRTDKHLDVGTLALAPETPNPLAAIRPELAELRASFEPGDATEVSFSVRGATLVFDLRKSEMSVNGLRAPAPLRNGRHTLTVYCDRTGLEVFAADGLTYVPMPFQPRPDDRSLSVRARGGTARFATLVAHELRSAWTPTSR
ncbi:MAG: GH32 C-terminal domain-containing protein, partial [Verrucomicrobiales bacterium]|nr:GH32 C-terminal domain-containing protein [Verrucomicrobiales bacterium]